MAGPDPHRNSDQILTRASGKSGLRGLPSSLLIVSTRSLRRDSVTVKSTDSNYGWFASRMPKLSRSILHISGNLLRRTFIGHLVIAGKFANALLDRTRNRLYLSACAFFPSPVKGFASGAFDSVISRRMLRLRF